MARRILRSIGWVLGLFASLAAIALIIVAAYLLLFDYPQEVRKTLETRMTEAIGREVKVGQFSIDLPKYAFSLRDLEIAARDPEAAPTLEVEEILGSIALSDLFQLQLHLAEIRVTGLTLRLPESGPEGMLARLPFGEGDRGRVSVEADRIVLEQANLVYADDAIPWSFDAGDVSFQVDRIGARRFRGNLSYQNGRLLLEDGAALPASLDARFELDAGELLLEELHATTDVGELYALGKVRMVGIPEGRLNVSGEVHVDKLASEATDLDAGAIRSNPLQFRGQLEILGERRVFRGRAALTEAELFGVPLEDWQANLFWDGSVLRLSEATGRLAGGNASLDIHQSWPPQKAPASVQLEVGEASLGSILSALSDAPVPWTSRVGAKATLSVSLTEPAILDARFQAQGVAPETPEEGRESLAFALGGTYHEGDVELFYGRFETEHTTLTLEGHYPGKGPVELLLQLESSDLSATDRLQLDVRRLANVEQPDLPELWGVEGRGSASGRLTARLPHLTFEGELAGEDVRFREVDWGQVRARVELGGGTLRIDTLSARRGESLAEVTGRIRVGRGGAGATDFEVTASVGLWPARDLLTFVGSSLPVSGSLSGKLDLASRLGSLDGTGSVSLEGVEIFGETVASAAARLTFDGSRMRATDISLRGDDLLVEGDAELDVATRDIAGSLRIERYPVRRPELTRWGIGGLGSLLSGTLSIDGTLDRPDLKLSASSDTLELAGRTASDTRLEARILGSALEANVRVTGEGFDASADVAGELEPGGVMSGRGRWSGFDVSPLVFADGPASFRMLSDGDWRFELRLSAPESLSVSARVSNVVVENENLRFVSLKPVDLQLSGSQLTLDELALSEASGQLRLGGTFDLETERVDLKAGGTVNMAILESFYPWLSPNGDVDVTAHLSGSWSRPSLTGSAEVKGGSLRLTGFPQAIGDIRGSVVFDARTVRLAELNAVFGTAPVTLSGTVSLDGITPDALELTMKGEGMRLRYPEGLVATVDADLTLAGTRDGQLLSGDIVVQDAVWTRDYELTSGMFREREEVQLLDELEGEVPLENLRFDIDITAPGTLRIRNSFATVEARAELELGGTFQKPVLMGRTEVERGELFFLGQRYNITTGKVEFVDPTRIEPFIDLSAESRVRSYRVILRVSGTPDRFYPELSSDPPLRTVDILRLLSGASERDILIGTEEEELAGVGAASLLTERLTQEVGKRAERLFGLDRFSINPFLVGQFSDPTARVSIGKRFRQDLSVNYSTNVNRTTETLILIEYTPEGPVTWIVSRDEFGHLGVDLTFRKTF